MSAPRLFAMRAGAIGDFVLTLPALAALRRSFPEYRLILAAREDVLPLVKGTLADEVLSYDSPLLAPLFAPDATLSRQVTRLFAELELAVLWLSGNAARTVAGNLGRLGVPRVLAADPAPAGRHAADQLLETLAPLGVAPPCPPGAAIAVPHLELTVEMAALAGKFWRAADLPEPSPTVALHPGSGGKHKRWPLQNFRALAERLAQLATLRVVLVTGPAEEDDAGSIGPLPAGIVPMHSPDLQDLASVLGRCSLYAGNDSGITHLAASLGVQTVALFGPTNHAIWGPRGGCVSIIRSPTGRMEDIPLTAVWEAVASRLRIDIRERR